MKKILNKVLCFISILLVISSVQAANSNNETNKIYQGKMNIGIFGKDFKSSANLAKKALPFINVATKNMTYNSDISSSGISIGNESVSVEKNLRGVHTIIGGDTITVDGSVEYAVIMAPNVVINGKIEKDTLIIAESLFITESAVIGNDVTIACTKAEIRGEVKGNLIGTTENLYLSGKIGKDIRVGAKEFKAEKETISGDVYIETDSDMNYIKDKYKDAKIMPYTLEQETEMTETNNIASLVRDGLILVIIYTAIAHLITKKENNFIDKMTTKIKMYTPFALIMGVVVLAMIPLVIFIILILAIFGLGIIAWPILVAYLAFIILASIIDIFVTGIVLSNIIITKLDKSKMTVAKKLAIYALMFALIYILTKITSYANMFCTIISIGILFTYITKKIKTEDVIIKVKGSKESK